MKEIEDAIREKKAEILRLKNEIKTLEEAKIILTGGVDMGEAPEGEDDD